MNWKGNQCSPCFASTARNCRRIFSNARLSTVEPNVVAFTSLIGGECDSSLLGGFQLLGEKDIASLFRRGYTPEVDWVVVLKMFYFHHYLGRSWRWSNLDEYFQPPIAVLPFKQHPVTPLWVVFLEGSVKKWQHSQKKCGMDDLNGLYDPKKINMDTQDDGLGITGISLEPLGITS